MFSTCNITHNRTHIKVQYELLAISHRINFARLSIFSSHACFSLDARQLILRRCVARFSLFSGPGAAHRAKWEANERDDDDVGSETGRGEKRVAAGACVGQRQNVFAASVLPGLNSQIQWASNISLDSIKCKIFWDLFEDDQFDHLDLNYNSTTSAMKG